MSDFDTIRSWFKTGDSTPIVYLVYSAIGQSNLRESLGRAEYSYFFVREIFRRALEKNGRVIVISDPPREVDKIFVDCEREGLRCIFLSFASPHGTFTGLRCPTVPVFAWEFDTIPNEVWSTDPRDDWRFVLSRMGCAITHSEYSAQAIRSAMGPDFPVVSIPAPLWDDAQKDFPSLVLPREDFNLAVDGYLIDSRSGSSEEARSRPNPDQRRKGLLARLHISAWLALSWYREVIADLLPTTVRRRLSLFARASLRQVRRLRHRNKPHPQGSQNYLNKDRDSVRVSANEVVYTSVFNPHDGRKNWPDMLTAFCTAFRDCDDATLILKFVHRDSSSAFAEVRATLARLPPYRCRIITIAGFIDDAAYRSLIARTTFVTNSSMGEGQCLPLMEFMSHGKPAVATRNTAMEEYVDQEVGFVVGSSPELCCWPQDTRNVFRAYRYRVDWFSLKAAFEESYRVAKHEPALYAQMATRAVAKLRTYCSEEITLPRLKHFLRFGAEIGPPSPPIMPFLPTSPTEKTDMLLTKLQSLSYFAEHAIPDLRSDFQTFDLSIPGDARELSNRFGIIPSGDCRSNYVHVHRNAARLKHATPVAFSGPNNNIIIGEDAHFHGAVTFNGRDNLVAVMGHHGRLALDATLYDGNTLICGRGAFAWGLRVWVQGGTSCTLGDDCLLSENIAIRTTDHHSVIDLESGMHTNPPADVKIGRHVWIGPSCTINKGAQIGDGAIVAGNSVVTGAIPNAELWGGAPARMIRQHVSWVRSFPPEAAEVARMYEDLNIPRGSQI
jgi:acetyltransferase-like isoleucine patch superfamily enzyme/glycosyltransferase involved in cell wall biosynthesis